MISFMPIWAVVLRHARVWRRDVNFMLFAFYWPILDILIWGFLGRWIQQSNTQFHNYEAAALLGILLWQAAIRGCNVMIMSFTEELWSNNIVNFFSLPLRIAEWMCGIVLFYTGIMAITTLFCMLIIYSFYDLSLLYMLKTFLFFLPPLFFCGIWLGFTCLQVIVNLGKRGIEVGFVLGWVLAPFSGAFYPIDVLPAWAQKVSSFVPMSYVFQSMRDYVMHGTNPTPSLVKGYILSIIYMVFAIVLFMYCFKRSKKYGLARLLD